MRFKKFLVKGGVKLDHGGGAGIDHSLGRRKLIVAFSAATHSFKTQAKETRRTSEIASQNAGFTRPSGDVPFQEGTEFPHFVWQFPSSVAGMSNHRASSAQCRVLWAPVIDSVISLTMEMMISSSFWAVLS